MATRPAARAGLASQVPGCHGVHVRDSAASAAAAAAHLSHEDAASESYIPVSGMSVVRVSKNRVLATGGTARDGRIMPFSVVRMYDCDPHAVPPRFNWLPPLRITRPAEKESKPCFPVPREAHTLTLDPTGKMLLLIGGRRKAGGGGGGGGGGSEDGVGRSPSGNAPSGLADGAGAAAAIGANSKPCGESLFALRIHEDGDHAWEPVTTQRAKSGMKHAVGPRFGHCAELRNVATASGRRAKASGAVYVHGGYSAVDACAPLATVHKLTVVTGSARRRDQYTCQWELVGSGKPARGKARPATGAGASVVAAPARAFHAASFLDSRYLVVHGGKTGPVETSLSDVCGDLFVYDTETDQWGIPADEDRWNHLNRPSPRAHHSATAGVGPDEGHVVFFGGQMQNGEHSDELFRLKLLPGQGTSFTAQWTKRRVSPPTFFCGLSRCGLVGFPDAKEYLVLCGKGKGGPLETALQFQPFQEIYETVRESEVLRELAAKEELATASAFQTPGTDRRSLPSAPILQGASASPFVSLPSHEGSIAQHSGAPSDSGVAAQPASDSQPGGYRDGNVSSKQADVTPTSDREFSACDALPSAQPNCGEAVAALSGCPEKSKKRFARESIDADQNVTSDPAAKTTKVEAAAVGAQVGKQRLQAEADDKPSAVVQIASVHQSPRRTRGDTVPACSLRKRQLSPGRAPLPSSKRPRAPRPGYAPETGIGGINGEAKARHREVANRSDAAGEAVTSIAPRIARDTDGGGASASPVEFHAASPSRMLEFGASNEEARNEEARNEEAGNVRHVVEGQCPASSKENVSSDLVGRRIESRSLETQDENWFRDSGQESDGNNLLDLVNDDDDGIADAEDDGGAEQPETRAMVPPAETPPAGQGESLPSHGGISPFYTVDEYIEKYPEAGPMLERGRGRGRARGAGRVRGAGRPRGRPRGSVRGRRAPVERGDAGEMLSCAGVRGDLDSGEIRQEVGVLRRELADEKRNHRELQLAFEKERAAKEMQQKFAEDAAGQVALLSAKLDKLRRDFNRDSSANLGSEDIALRNQLEDRHRTRLDAQRAEIAKLKSEKVKVETNLRKALADHQATITEHEALFEEGAADMHSRDELIVELKRSLTGKEEKLKTIGDVTRDYSEYKNYVQQNEESLRKELESALAATRNEKRAREEARKRQGDAIQETEKARIELSQRNRMCTDLREKNKDLEKEVKALSSALEVEKAKYERDTRAPAADASTCLRARCRKQASASREHERALADKSVKVYELQARVESLTKALEGQKDKARRLDDERQSARAEAAASSRTSSLLRAKCARMETQLRTLEGSGRKLSTLILGVTGAVASLGPLSENLQRASDSIFAGFGNPGEDVSGVVGDSSGHGDKVAGVAGGSVEGGIGIGPAVGTIRGSTGNADNFHVTDAPSGEHLRVPFEEAEEKDKAGRDCLSEKPSSEMEVAKEAPSFRVGSAESGEMENEESSSGGGVVSPGSQARVQVASENGLGASAPIQGERANGEGEICSVEKVRALESAELTLVKSSQARPKGKAVENAEVVAVVVEKGNRPGERDHENVQGIATRPPGCLPSSGCQRRRGGQVGEGTGSPARSPEVEDKSANVDQNPADAQELGIAVAAAAEAAVRIDTAGIAMDDDSDDAPSP